MKRLLSLWIALCMSITILAADGDVNKVTVDGIEWTYMVLSEANKTCKIGVS